MGQAMEICFDPGALALAEIRERTHAMWSDIAFDKAVLQRLQRDGLLLDGVRLTGPSPYRFDSPDGGTVRVQVAVPTGGDLLLDLWRLHFSKGLSAADTLP